MESVVTVILFAHVGFGIIALCAAFVALGVRKGSTAHNRSGIVYVAAMSMVAVTAIPVTFARPNPFLFFIALFSSYLALGGWRFGKKSRTFGPLDRVAPVGMILLGAVMVGYGVWMAMTSAPIGWALVAFGGISLQFGIQDIVAFRREIDFRQRISLHLSHMMGGTIAAITAVLVQQVVPRLGDYEQYAVVVWLAPTIIITPLIAVWSARVLKTGKTRLRS